MVYDDQSKQLRLRDASRNHALDLPECPYCHQSYRREPLQRTGSAGEESNQYAPGQADAGFVNPQYFRMLHHSSSTPSVPSSREGSPGTEAAAAAAAATAAAVGGSSVPQEPSGPSISRLASGIFGSGKRKKKSKKKGRAHGISSAAFTHNYFRKFFIEERELGRGGKGVVLLVRHVLDGVPLGHFACKRVPVGDDHEWLEKVLVEVQLLQNLSHPNLVSYRHVWLEECQVTSFGPSIPCAFILQQYCNAGDLQSYVLGSSVQKQKTPKELKELARRRSKGQLEQPLHIHNHRKMHFEEILSFFKDITSGLHHLHASGYIHRDLKPNNCLLHNTGNKLRLLVSDFGEVQLANVARKSTGATGTVSYCAPEVLRRSYPDGTLGNFTTKSDIFSLGMIVYFMCFGRLPYESAEAINHEEEDLDELREEIGRWSGFDDGQMIRKDLPEQLYKFLKRLLSVDPEMRPTTEEILREIKAGAGIDDFMSTPRPSFVDPSRPRAPKTEPHLSNQTHSYSPGSMNGTSTAILEPDDRPIQDLGSQENQTFLEEGESERLKSGALIRSRTVNLPAPLQSNIPYQPKLLEPPPSRIASLRGLLARTDIQFMIKVLVFVVKAVSASLACSPYTTSMPATVVLFAAAALDFSPAAYNDGNRYRQASPSLMLIAVHAGLLVAAGRLGSLCA